MFSISKGYIDANTKPGKGFHITFDNGWTVSVQWGHANYSENYNGTDGNDSLTAEIAAWDTNDDWHDFGDDTVQGYMTANQVLEFMVLIANKAGDY